MKLENIKLFLLQREIKKLTTKNLVYLKLKIEKTLKQRIGTND